MTETGPTPADGEVVTVATHDLIEDVDGLPLGMERHTETAVFVHPHHAEEDTDDDH